MINNVHPFTKRKPPHNYEAEQALLGAIFANNEVWNRVNGFLKPDHFADALHGRIYEACGNLISKGRIANPVTLKLLFDQDGALAEIGGAKYLVDLAQAVVTVMNAEDYGVAVRDLYVRRQLIGLAEDLFADAFMVDPMRSPMTIVEGIAGRLEEIATAPGNIPADQAVRSMGEIMDAVLEQAEAAYKGGAAVRGLATGLSDVDFLLNGLCAGDFFVLAARPGMGKTAMALTLARNIAQAGKRVGIESIEMTDTQLGLRSLAGDSGVPTTKVRRGEVDGEDLQRMIEAANDLRGLKIHVASSGAPTMDELAARWRAHKIRFGLDFLIVDYLQLVRDQSSKKGGRYEEVTAVSGGHKALAKTLGIPILGLSQLSRQVETRDNKRPTLADLRESGAIEQDADQVGFLYRDEYYLEKDEPQRGAREDEEKFSMRLQVWNDRLDASRNVAEFILAKNRHGRIGSRTVHFDPDRQRFGDMASE